MAQSSRLESLAVSVLQNVFGFGFGFAFQQLSTETARPY